MTTAEDLRNEILDFIKTKKEEIEMECDEHTMPFIMTIAEPETDDDAEYAQKQLDEALMDRNDCNELLDNLEFWLNANAEVATKDKRGNA